MECQHEGGNINSNQINITTSLQARFCMLPGALPISSAQSNPFVHIRVFLCTKEMYAYF